MYTQSAWTVKWILEGRQWPDGVSFDHSMIFSVSNPRSDDHFGGKWQFINTTLVTAPTFRNLTWLYAAPDTQCCRRTCTNDCWSYYFHYSRLKHNKKIQWNSNGWPDHSDMPRITLNQYWFLIAQINPHLQNVFQITLINQFLRLFCGGP